MFSKALEAPEALIEVFMIGFLTIVGENVRFTRPAASTIYEASRLLISISYIVHVVNQRQLILSLLNANRRGPALTGVALMTTLLTG